MTSNREKAIHGISWSFIDNIGNKVLQFFVGIVMARLLTPHDYGVLGMVTVFVSFSHIFIDSGFSQSLVIRKNCKREEYSTVFFFNFAMGLMIYGIFYATSPLIADFFKVPELSSLIRVFSLTVVISSTSLVQRIQMSKSIDFRSQAIISSASTIISSIVGISLAWNGMGIWSLIIRMLVESVISASMYWAFGGFRLAIVFDTKAFREMFAFGSKMLFSGIIDRGYEEMYKVVIGKFFRVEDLGFYQRAIQFSEIPSSGFTSIIQRVSSPVLAQLEPDRVKPAYRKLIKSITLVVFAMMIGLAATAKNIVLVLLGSKWIEVVPYLQLLCLSTVLYPLHALNLEIIWVRGFSGLFLRLEIIKKLIALPIIFVGIFYGIFPMLVGMIVVSVLAYFVNSFYSGRLVDYPVTEQIKDLLPLSSLVATMGICVWTLGFIPLESHLLLAIQLFTGIAVVMGLSEVFRLEPYLEIKRIILAKLGRDSK